MDEQQLIIEPPLTFCNFFQRLFHRFMNGNAPYIPNAEPYQVPQQIPFSFAFDSHPGPIDDAVTDAKNLHRSLFVFIYCKENPTTWLVSSVLQRPEVASEIRDNFIFLPLDVTWPEGWRVACELEFKAMPLIALIRPRGSSLWESNIYVKYEGKVGESTLLSSLRIESRQRNPDTSIVQQQDNEFEAALRRAEADAQRNREMEVEADKEAEEEENMKRRVEEEYQKLIDTDPVGELATIRFQFQGMPPKTHKFHRDAPVDNLFVFVRKFMFPRKFSLMTGFPQRRLEENGAALRDECPERQFIVHVEELDE